MMSCDTTPFCGQDAQYGWDVTHSETERFVRTEAVLDEPVVLDNVTGLVWEGCPAGLRGSVCDCGGEALYRWNGALAYCNDLIWGGYLDWRLPDQFEARSIVDYGRSEPAINPMAFPGTPSTQFWSSSSHANNIADAWFVGFDVGDVYDASKTYTNGTRCVRGGSASSSQRFVRTVPVADQPVVEDSRNRSVWQGCGAGQTMDSCTGTKIQLSWQQSLAYCENLDWGQHADWRLPNINELHSIIDARRYNPSMDPAVFPGTTAGIFWSSSSHVLQPDRAWTAGFTAGDVTDNLKTWNRFVRCVREDL